MKKYTLKKVMKPVSGTIEMACSLQSGYGR